MTVRHHLHTQARTHLWRKARAATAVLASLTLVAGMTASTAGPAYAASSKVGRISDTPAFSLQTRVVTATPAEPGDHLKVTVGDVSHAAPAAPDWACPTGAWVLVLNRASLDVVSSTDYPLCSDADASQLAQTLKTIPNTNDQPALVIVNSLNHHPGGNSLTLTGLGDALSQIGAPAAGLAGLDLSTTGFSVYGIPGLTPGQAYTAQDSLTAEAAVPAGSPVPASVNGTLFTDDRGNYTLTMLDYGLYDISPDGAITIKDHTYPVPAEPAGFQGGFHVLAVNRRTLQPVSDTLYETSGKNSPEPELGQYRMDTYLARLAASDDEGVLLFLSAVGNPGGNQLPAGPPPSSACPAGAALKATAFTITCTFSFAGSDPWAGSQQEFTVPTADVIPGVPVTSLHVVLQGGFGGYAVPGGDPSPEGGDGDQVTADLPVGTGQPVHPGQTLYVEVGGNGTSGGQENAGLGGWNGGADGGRTENYQPGYPGGGGGGASDIRTVSSADPGSLASRLAVAGGGGGGGGDSRDGHGGGGGDAGRPGGNGVPGGGGGGAGTSFQGGAGGSGGVPGQPGTPGDGGAASANYGSGAGGGGGGGLYGGGGGGGAADTLEQGAGGGGGGSDLVPAGGTAEPIAGQELNNQPATVAISYPSPYGPTLAQLLRPFGATPGLIDDLNSSPRYALVGALSPAAGQDAGSFDAPEASPQIRTGATGELQGVLARGNQNMWYGPAATNIPVVRTVNGQQQPPTVVNYGLYHVLSQVSAPWPVPAGAPGSEEYQAQAAALQFLSQQVCGPACPDIRDEYDSLPNTIQQWQSAMQDAAFEAGHGFDEATFTLVKNQLVTELGDVYAADGLEQQMHTLLSDKQQLLGPALRDAYTDVRKTIPVDNSAQVLSIIYLVCELLTVVAAPIPGASEALGVVSAFVGFAGDLANDSSGESLGALNTTVNDLADQAVKGFTASLESVTQTFDYVFSDWGKLSAVADGLTHDAPAWDITDPAKYVLAMTNAIKLSYYRALVPLEYQLAEAQAAPTADLSKWCVWTDYAGDCLYDASSFQYPSSAYSFAVHAPFLGYGDAHDNILAGTALVRPIPLPQDGFPAGLMTDMQDAGLYTPYLFLRWPLKRNLCAAGNWSEDRYGSTICG